MNKNILILCEYYLPGTNAGGIVTSIHNLCSAFSKTYNIFILCKNHDLHSKTLYETKTNTWIDAFGVKIMYVNDKTIINRKFLFNLFAQFDSIYCCGYYWKTALRLCSFSRKNKSVKCIIAVMGSLGKGALKIKRFKKILFYSYVKLFGIFKYITWSCTSNNEVTELLEMFPKAKYEIAEDCITLDNLNPNPKICDKRFVFISRINTIKNLDYAIKILGELKKEIVFDVYGILEDKIYYKKCVDLASTYKNLHFKYCGELKPTEVVSVFKNYDFFLFPSSHENFGHVIFEALKAGCIPIISSNTPWNELTKNKCGFVCEKFNDYMEIVSKLLLLKNSEIVKIKETCVSYATEKYNEAIQKSGFKKLFSD